jgi:hypothetical protein
MNAMKIAKLFIACCLCMLAAHATAQTNAVPANKDFVYTFTYLKAKPGERDNLKQFLIKNWFAMDSIAVQQGLFNAYQLFENQAQDSTQWDFTVVVTYPTPKGFEAIADRWPEVTKLHKKVLINGKDFKDLGRVTGSVSSREAFRSTPKR